MGLRSLCFLHPAAGNKKMTEDINYFGDDLGTYFILADNIKKYRTQLGLSQQKFGEQIGVTKATISVYELSKRLPSRETLEKMADFFQVSIDTLLGREGGTLKIQEPSFDFVPKYVIPKYDSLQGLKTDQPVRQITLNEIFSNLAGYLYFEPKEDIPPMLIDVCFSEFELEDEELLLVTNKEKHMQVITVSEKKKHTEFEVIGKVICIFCGI